MEHLSNSLTEGGPRNRAKIRPSWERHELAVQHLPQLSVGLAVQDGLLLRSSGPGAAICFRPGQIIACFAVPLLAQRKFC
jgi:hypothetical protein